jgi:hypothetical protein
MRLEKDETGNFHQVIPNGMFILSSAGNKKIYLFTSHEIRVIPTTNDEKTTYANKILEQVAVETSTQHLAVQSRSSTSIYFDVIDLSQGLA